VCARNPALRARVTRAVPLSGHKIRRSEGGSSMLHASKAKYVMVPGPTPVEEATRRVYAGAYDTSPDLEEEFFTTYRSCETLLLKMLHGSNHQVAIMSGEAMVALWGAIKSVVVEGDVVVCLGNGVYGNGFVAMVKSAGGNVIHIRSDYHEPLDVERLDQAVRGQKVKLVTAVHLDTPSGVLNRNLKSVGLWCQK
jgi:aspartate aminotransferase-like enzyme